MKNIYLTTLLILASNIGYSQNKPNLELAEQNVVVNTPIYKSEELTLKENKLTKTETTNNINTYNDSKEINLSFYDQNNNYVQDYTGVRVGEYYWMNNNFTLPLGASQTTMKQVDYIHNCYKMFNFCDRCKGDNPSYWSYYGEMSDEQKLEEFNKVYGQYYPVRPANKPLANGKMLEASSPKDMGWGLPSEADVLQLLAMCGNATTHEIRQYLSFDNQMQSLTKRLPIPARFAVGPYFGWFAQIPDLINSTQYYPNLAYPINTNGYNPNNNNKYGLNFVPAGAKFHNSDQIITENYGEIKLFPSQQGDFNGLNQVLYLKTELSVFALHDFPEMKYPLSMSWFPVRFCRQLTDQELGYKIYINQNMDSQLCQTNDWAYPTRTRSGEEILLEKVRSKKIAPKDIDIVVKTLNEKAPTGYNELPKGYIRGFYVQYILDNNENPKSIEEIIDIAIQNPYLWLVRDFNYNPTGITDANIAHENGHNIYPNPVKDYLYINNSSPILNVTIYKTNGEVCANLQNINDNIDLSALASGLYIVNIKTAQNVYTHKIFKE